MDDKNCGCTNDMKMWPSQLYILKLVSKQLQIKLKKGFAGFNRIQLTHGFHTGAAVLH